jgi:hypothetical protein
VTNGKRVTAGITHRHCRSPQVSEGTLHQGTTLAKRAATVQYANDCGCR